jgi:hypothetical protein
VEGVPKTRDLDASSFGVVALPLSASPVDMSVQEIPLTNTAHRRICNTGDRCPFHPPYPCSLKSLSADPTTPERVRTASDCLCFPHVCCDSCTQDQHVHSAAWPAGCGGRHECQQRAKLHAVAAEEVLRRPPPPMCANARTYCSRRRRRRTYLHRWNACAPRSRFLCYCCATARAASAARGRGAIKKRADALCALSMKHTTASYATSCKPSIAKLPGTPSLRTCTRIHRHRHCRCRCHSPSRPDSCS